MPDRLEMNAIVRPSGDQHRIGVVVVAVGQRKRIVAVERQQPELLPLAAEIAAVDDAPVVGRDVGSARATTSLRDARAAARRRAVAATRTMSPVPWAISRFDTNSSSWPSRVHAGLIA